MDHSPGHAELLKKVNGLLNLHARKRVNGNVASHSTTTTKGQTLRTIFTDLYELGYRLTEPTNIGTRHIEVLCKHWHKSGIAVSTIQGRLSVLRIFAGWVGKKGLVKSLPTYLPDVPKGELRVIKTAQSSKSWTENGVDVIAKIKMADELDTRFGLMLRLAVIFGLRRKEIVHLMPWKCDRGDMLAVYESKNGKPRNVYVDTVEQRQILDIAKSHVKKGQYIGWQETVRGKTATIAYNLRRYNRCMAAIGITKKDSGVTGHGLRSQFAENAALILDMVPPTLGGKANQMPREDLDVKREQVSELLGHSRKSITNSYYGSYGRETSDIEVNRSRTAIASALEKMTSLKLPEVPDERMADCTQLVSELIGIEVLADPIDVQYLWELHSQRHGIPWLKPREGNVVALEVAALKVNRSYFANTKPSQSTNHETTATH